MSSRNATPEELRQLSEQFRALGAHDPDSWAKSHLEEKLPQYQRLVFLRQAWSNVIGDGDTSWISAKISYSERYPREPGAGAGPALKNLLAAGASQEDLTEVVRVMQWELLFNLMYMLGDPRVVDYPSPDLPHVNWGLFELNDRDDPIRPINSLHESVLDTDPTGREMRPKGIGREG